MSVYDDYMKSRSKDGGANGTKEEEGAEANAA